MRFSDKNPSPKDRRPFVLPVFLRGTSRAGVTQRPIRGPEPLSRAAPDPVLVRTSPFTPTPRSGPHAVTVVPMALPHLRCDRPSTARTWRRRSPGRASPAPRSDPWSARAGSVSWSLGVGPVRRLTPAADRLPAEGGPRYGRCRSLRSPWPSSAAGHRRDRCPRSARELPSKGRVRVVGALGESVGYAYMSNS